jgi:hypothetical protein
MSTNSSNKATYNVNMKALSPGPPSLRHSIELFDVYDLQDLKDLRHKLKVSKLNLKERVALKNLEEKNKIHNDEVHKKKVYEYNFLHLQPSK